VVAVVEEADVPVGAHAGEELQQGAGTLGKLEAIDELVVRERGAAPTRGARAAGGLVLERSTVGSPCCRSARMIAAVSSRPWMPTPTKTCALVRIPIR
jgi:hypothetical protein